MDENVDGIFNIAPLNDVRFNQLEQSQNLSQLREPSFCKCIPIAKGTCCGFVSLKIILVIIACIDITIGGAAIGIGITAFLKSKLKMSIIAFALINGISFILAFACLYAIIKMNIKIMKFYFIWKCIEVVIIPIFEIVIFIISIREKQDFTQTASITYYATIFAKACFRLYFAYLIYSFYKRLDRGESLLVEYGQRRLSNMI